MLFNNECCLLIGHGNMARKMGIHYDRVDIESKDSNGDGARVPTAELSDKVMKMVSVIHGAPTCVIPAVISDPYLEKLNRSRHW